LLLVLLLVLFPGSKKPVLLVGSDNGGGGGADELTSVRLVVERKKKRSLHTGLVHALVTGKVYSNYLVTFYFCLMAFWFSLPWNSSPSLSIVAGLAKKKNIQG
jgi:hypothetical protein